MKKRIMLHKENRPSCWKTVEAKVDILKELKKIKTNARSPEAYRNYLEANGFTEKDLRKSLEERYLFETIMGQELYAKIAVTEADIRARYKKEMAKLKKPLPEFKTEEEEAEYLATQYGKP